MGDEFASYAGLSFFPVVTEHGHVSARWYKKGPSIAEKRSEIAAQLTQIRNAHEVLGLGTYSIDKLSSALEKRFDKATAGYWRGGLRDPFWRCITTPRSPGFFCSMVADQLDEQCPELMTPSARRFLKILSSLSDALDQERRLLDSYVQVVTENNAAQQAGALVEPSRRWEVLDSAKRRCMALRAATAPVVDEMRRHVDLACASVRPEKKHHGKREALNGGLYVGAAIIALIAFSVSSVVVAVVSFTFTMLIRCVSLGSIRGFDREKGWKAVESLLDQAKEFINSEEHAMNMGLNDSMLLAQFDQQRMAWEQGQEALALAKKALEQGQKTWSAVTVLQGNVTSLKDNVSTLTNDVGTLKTDVSSLKQSMGAVEQNVALLRDDFKRMSNAIAFNAVPLSGPYDAGPREFNEGGRGAMVRATSLEVFRSRGQAHTPPSA